MAETVLEPVLIGIDPDNNPSVYALPATPQLVGDSQRQPASYELVSSTIGLSTRIQLLLHDPRLCVEVTSGEQLMNSSVVSYTIRLSLASQQCIKTKNLPSHVSVVVKRRYSEFCSLRSSLLKLFPASIIPPIPEKHSIITYLVNSINTSQEMIIIEARKRCFTRFLEDLIHVCDSFIVDCPVLHKFLDPNYELCWDTALVEPPINLIPGNMLLANPTDPTDQNGLYALLPSVNGFDFNASIDNLSSLKKLNDDLQKLAGRIQIYDLKSDEYYESTRGLPSNTIGIESNVMNVFEEMNDIEQVDTQESEAPKNDSNTGDDTEEYEEEGTNDSFVEFICPRAGEYPQFTSVPGDLQMFEAKFHKLINVLATIDKVNSHSTKNYKLIVATLIELGANLNNFSLEVFEAPKANGGVNHPPDPTSLSFAIEQFGFTIDQNFVCLEGFVKDDLIPQWNEPIHQLVQYYSTALNLIKFLKFKIVQLKVLYKIKFNKFRQLSNIAYTSGSNFDNLITTDAEAAHSLGHLKGLNSQVLANTLHRIETLATSDDQCGTGSKKSWYGIFGGNNGYSKQFSSSLSRDSSLDGMPPLSKSKKAQIEKDLHKLNQLLELANNDIFRLTLHLCSTFEKFLIMMEKRWLNCMVKYLERNKRVFLENLGQWKELKKTFTSTSRLQL